MKSLWICLLAFAGLATESFYDQPVPLADGHPLYLPGTSGKKILVVNIATSGGRQDQLGELQRLQEQMRDSLVIIAVPSNQFGNATGSTPEIAAYCRQQYSASYYITEKLTVSGTGQHALYQWLTQSSRNGTLNSEVKSDFQKYLVDRNGQLLGIYAGSMSVFHPSFIHALNQ